MSEQKDVELTTIPVAWGVDEYGVPVEQDDTSTDYQQRAEALEQLLRDTLLYIKGLSEYNWHNAPKVIALQDRAADLGIVPEVQP